MFLTSLTRPVPVVIAVVAATLAACGSTAPQPSSAGAASAAAIASSSTAVSSHASETPEPTDTPQPTETPLPTSTPTPTATPTPIYQPIEELEIGQCYISIDDSDDGAPLAAQLVDCTEPHSSEVFLVEQLEGGADAPFPGEDALEVQAGNRCDPAFEEYVGTPYRRSRLEYVYFFPTQGTWSTGDRLLQCVIEEKGEMFEESVKRSGE